MNFQVSGKPIFMATHPRACSTAFERVFMTRTDSLTCVHEPFGDAFYFGPERLGTRYENDKQARLDSGFSECTYQNVFERLEREASQGKRLFIKDIIHYLVPPEGKPATIAPSLQIKKRGIGTDSMTNSVTNEVTNGVCNDSVNGHTNGTANGVEESAPYPYKTAGEPGNPTVVPAEILNQFHFTFLIRSPLSSIASYYRCTVPPLDKVTGFYNFDPSEAGYDEVRRVFEYLRSAGQVGPQHANDWNSNSNQIGARSPAGVEICVVDADDMLDDPEGIIKAYCKSVGLDFQPSMLIWDDDESHDHAEMAFRKWKGFHEDAIHSTDLKPRAHKKKQKTREAYDAEWTEKFGEEAAAMIRQTVDKNMDDYLFMKQFAITPQA